MGRLFWKIFLGFWLTLLITGSTVGVLVWQHNKERIEQLEVLVDSPRAELSVKSAAKILRQEGTAALKEVLERRQIRHHRASRLLIINEQGIDLLGRSVPEVVLRKAREALNTPEQAAIQQVTTPQNERYLLFVPRRNHPAMHRKELYPVNLPLLPLFVIFIGSILFSAVLAWYITRPIRFLREATNRFAEGKLDTRVMQHIGTRKDEIAELAKDFDHMAEQVQQLIAAQKRLLNDVSHELRSPLARLQVAVEIGRQQPQEMDKLMLRVEKESRRLDELVGELLTLSRLEAEVTTNKENDYFDINGLVESIVKDANFEIGNQNKQILFTKNNEILINANMELLRRAIENVIRNAIFYTPESGRVDISLTQKNNLIKITVCDNGNGVDENKLSQLFLPFVRISDSNQNVTIPGYGLGLAIARRAIEIHDGNISAFNCKQGGLCIEMCLPSRVIRS